MSQPRFGRMIPAMVTPFDENRELDLDKAQALAARLAVANAHYREGGRSLVRYVADEPAVPGSVPASPTLEDLYLYVFRDEAAPPSTAAPTRAARKGGRHA